MLFQFQHFTKLEKVYRHIVQKPLHSTNLDTLFYLVSILVYQGGRTTRNNGQNTRILSTRWFFFPKKKLKHFTNNKNKKELINKCSRQIRAVEPVAEPLIFICNWEAFILNLKIKCLQLKLFPSVFFKPNFWLLVLCCVPI